MSYPINYPTPQGANVQIFKEGGSTSDWVKPQGASFVWFTLIGAGGGADQYGGGSGAITNYTGPAFLMPDVLRVFVGAGGIGAITYASGGSAGGATIVTYQQKDGTGYALLTANGGLGAQGGTSGGSGGAASTSNFFSASGFFQSIAGQTGGAGTSGGNVSASATTFLSGGSAGAPGTSPGVVTPNYGYPTVTSSKAGYFQTQPIIVGCGGGGGDAGGNRGGNGGIGCGGGGRDDANTSVNGKGGDGLAVIITW